METGEQTTLRDQLAANLEAVTAEPKAPEVDAIEPEGVTDDAVVGETTEQREARLRDEKGRFAKATETPDAEEVTEAPAPAEKPKPSRPSAWKKDYWEAFDKLAAENPNLAQYIHQRESEYAKGVSTYKQEAERAQRLWGAIEPFMADLQANNIAPDQWISNLGRAHQTLAMGSPMQKMQMFQKLAQDYGVPMQSFQQPQQPQMDANGQPVQPSGFPMEQFMPLVNPLYDQVNQLRGQLQTWQSAQQQEQQKQIQTEIERFSADKPYFEQVKPTMARLLEAGIAQDLKEAHDMAVRMPQHNDVFESMQQQQRQETERKAAEERRANTQRARSQTVSTRSTTPTGKAEKGNGKTGLREMLEEQFDAHASGRV